MMESNYLISQLANEIARARLKQQLTQVDLAKKLKCSPKLVRCFESNEKIPSFKKILQICEVLEFSLGEFLNRAEFT